MARTGVHYVRISGKGDLHGGNYFAMAANLKNIVEDELIVAGKAGAAEGRDFIDTAGTGNSWATDFNGRSSSSPGRVDTGNMRDSVAYRIFQGKGVGLDVGWVHHWEEYFGAQEKGFSQGGFRPNQVVKGMGMMAHLRAQMEGKTDAAMDRAIERILDGL